MSIQRALEEDGFVVIDGPVAQGDLAALARAYDRAVAEADAADVKVGSTSIRVTDFVHRGGGEFDSIYVHEPLLELCSSVFGEPFRLSSVLARTLRAGAAPSKLHVDYASEGDAWPMVGFIYMVDAFREENGATRFWRGSQGMRDGADRMDATVAACGEAGSMIVYNGSVWHEHGVNLTDAPRRSIQGAFVRRSERAAVDWAARMRPEVWARLGPVARDLLGL